MSNQYGKYEHTGQKMKEELALRAVGQILVYVTLAFDTNNWASSREK